MNTGLQSLNRLIKPKVRKLSMFEIIVQNQSYIADSSKSTQKNKKGHSKADSINYSVNYELRKPSFMNC